MDSSWFKSAALDEALMFVGPVVNMNTGFQANFEGYQLHCDDSIEVDAVDTVLFDHGMIKEHLLVFRVIQGNFDVSCLYCFWI